MLTYVMENAHAATWFIVNMCHVYFYLPKMEMIQCLRSDQRVVTEVVTTAERNVSVVHSGRAEGDGGLSWGWSCFSASSASKL